MGIADQQAPAPGSEVAPESRWNLALPSLTALGRLTATAESFRADPPEEPVLNRSGDDFTDLLSLLTIDNLLASGGLRRPDFRIIRDGTHVPDSHFTRNTLMHAGLPDTRKITNELKSGSTLVLQGLQEYCEPISSFTRRLAHDLSRPVHANAYVTPPRSQGFGSHFDPQDAFIVQVQGSKEWTVREPALQRPLAHESWDHVRRQRGWDAQRLEKPPPWRELVLKPGDCLWLPRGWVHSARSGQATSLHLTLSLATWTRHWAALGLMSQLVAAPGRAPLPADFVRDDDCAIAVVRRLRAELATWFEQTPDAELAEILRKSAIREFSANPRQISAFITADEVIEGLEFTVNSEVVLATARRGDRFLLYLADAIARLPAAAAPLCREILGRSRFIVRDLAADVSPAIRADAVRLLWREGIISRRDT